MEIDAIQQAILQPALESEQEAVRISEQLAIAGQPYEAARCLEVVAQRWLGLGLSGQELVGYETPGFGTFHRRIGLLLDGGRLYLQAKRPRNAKAIVWRALLFVEEALRSLESFREDDQASLCCLALGFELAGHCCLVCGEPDGLNYYQASCGYWGKAVRMRPEAFPQWAQHPVTSTVIRCLETAAEILCLERPERECLTARDYPTRLETAQGFFAR